MFWADRIAGEIEARFGRAKELRIRDEKTVSGRVHIGSMRGVAIHGTVKEALADRGVQASFRYELNDFDPLDDLPVYLPREKFKEHLGKPLYAVPSPSAEAANYADYFGREFSSVIERAGWSPEFIRSSELYLSGKMNGAIRTALEKAADIRRIYKEVSGSERSDVWLPVNVICPACGKMSTTEADDFDGQTVHYVCRQNAVTWTKGCGSEGRISPFDGRAKLVWKADWPAKWQVLGVDIEGGGKDHSTKGGSRDVANHISRDVFGAEPPFDIPYEFFLVGGKKMSSSKGRGSSAVEIAGLLPQKIFRLMLLSKDINQAINFDPEGDTIPVLYDLYDKLAEHVKEGAQDDYARLFLLSHSADERADIRIPFLPRFSQVAFAVQMPHLDLEREMEKLKGAPLDDADRAELAERAAYARTWLDAHAPERFVFKLQEAMPEAARGLDPAQKKALGAIAGALEERGALEGDAFHSLLHEVKGEQGIEPGALFAAVYFAFLGKPYGPKAGWFLSVLPREFVLKRLREAAA